MHGQEFIPAVTTLFGYRRFRPERINDHLDPDALNALFDESESATRQIVFHYHGYEIVVEGADQVQATPLEDDGS